MEVVVEMDMAMVAVMAVVDMEVMVEVDMEVVVEMAVVDMEEVPKEVGREVGRARRRPPPEAVTTCRGAMSTSTEHSVRTSAYVCGVLHMVFMVTNQ